MDINVTHIATVASELSIKPMQVMATLALLDEGSTVPFIARYRKEVTGTLDEVFVTAIRDRVNDLRELDKRREAILKSLKERELLTEELEKQVMSAATLSELEDVYLPYRPKKRTRAMIAREKGLEPLALMIYEQKGIDPATEAAAFIDAEKGVVDVDEALAGARDIIAELVNEDKAGRERMREHFMTQSTITSKLITGKEVEGAKFRDYFDWQEPAKAAPSHRVLAMRRGEREGILVMRHSPPEDSALMILEAMFVKGTGADSAQVRLAVQDCYKRLLSLSMETELRLVLKKHSDEEAIKVFRQNLRQLLLASPLGQKNVLALDPGFRTGCKVVCLDRQGALKEADAIFPHGSAAMADKARAQLQALCAKHSIEAIAIGNGTASRETETFVRSAGLPPGIAVVMVNESGASIYSASEVARKEFPDQDITIRGAASIGRRLMDPLAELVKIDPKSIGVGQYQHDVDQSMLKQSLDDVVESCVNAVGVELNTASPHLLTYVSGLGPTLAQNIVAFRDENGPFKNRTALKKVPRLGPKAFEQSAGFLRVRDSKNPLDRSAVHPESYHIVEQMAEDLGASVEALMESAELRQKIDLQKYVTDKVGLPTLTDIMQELAKPGRDPREQFEAFSFKEGVHEMKDLEVAMRLPGIVTNVTNFGAFVDIGVHQDGLVHISQLSDSYVRTPADVVKVGQRVDALVLEVDIERRRIALSLKKDAALALSMHQGKGQPQDAKAKPKQAYKPKPEPPKPAPKVDPATALRKLKCGK